jgi:sulfur relay (sulfurtransferase) DsrC/TusE family protein
MTENIIEPASTPEIPTDSVEPADKSNREAAKYRRQLRDVEAERDGLLEQVTGWRKQQAENIAQAHGLNAAALWAAGAELETMLTEEGMVDEAKLIEFVKEAKDKLGIVPPPQVASAAGQGRVGTAIAVDTNAGNTWADALRKNK